MNVITSSYSGGLASIHSQTKIRNDSLVTMVLVFPVITKMNFWYHSCNDEHMGFLSVQCEVLRSCWYFDWAKRETASWCQIININILLIDIILRSDYFCLASHPTESEFTQLFVEFCLPSSVLKFTFPFVLKTMSNLAWLGMVKFWNWKSRFGKTQTGENKISVWVYLTPLINQYH